MANKGYETSRFPYLDPPQLTPSRRTERKTQSKDIMGGILGGKGEILLGGDASVKIDPANRRIIISDGTNDRVLIGYDEDGF